MCQSNVAADEVENRLLQALRTQVGIHALTAHQLLQENGICLSHFCEAVHSLSRRGLIRSSDVSNPIHPQLPASRILELGLEPNDEPSGAPPADRGLRRLPEGIDIFLDRPLGRGSYGSVYAGEQTRLKRPVAVKVLHLPSLPSTSIRKWFVEHFRREPQLIARLNHPHIVQVIDCGEDGEDLWFAMELLEGGTLADRIRQEGRIPAPEIRVYFKAVAQALLEASNHGILHRDIKPRNIFNAGPKVADFGLAKFMPDRGEAGIPGATTPTAAIIGSPPYIAPERANFQSGDLRSDIYSLGATMYHAATGRLLFNLDPGDRKAWYHHHLVEKPRPLFYAAPEFPVDLGETIHRCLAKDPNDRFRTFEALLKRLGP